MNKSTASNENSPINDIIQSNIASLLKKGYGLLVTEKLIAEHDNFLIPIVSGNKIGFIDRQGNVAVTPKYVSCNGDFINKDSIVSAQLKNKWEAINYKGDILFSLLYYQHLGAFVDGYAIARNRMNDWGYINTKGIPVIPFAKYMWYSHFENDLARVIISVNKMKLWGIINRKGDEVVQPRYNRIDTLKDLSKVWVEDLNGRIFSVDFSNLC